MVISTFFQLKFYTKAEKCGKIEIIEKSKGKGEKQNGEKKNINRR